jgi:hypothetical protein
MIGRRVANIIKRFARHRDYMRFTKSEPVRGFDAKGETLRRPAKHCLPNFTPLWADWNLGANRSGVVSGGIYQCDVNIAVCFHFCVYDAPCKRVPFLLVPVPSIGVGPEVALSPVASGGVSALGLRCSFMTGPNSPQTSIQIRS